MLKPSEEKYLKAIYHVSQTDNTRISIALLSDYLDLKRPTVHERVGILEDRKLITNKKATGIRLTKTGLKLALSVVRKHRVWETFLVKICKFTWSEVHELAEQLQNINSEKLLDRIYLLSGEPRFDPHGDPIPDKSGVLPVSVRRPFSQSVEGCKCVVVGVDEDSHEFLTYLTELHIGLNDKLFVEKIFGFDGSLKVKYRNNLSSILSAQVAAKIQVTCIKPNCLCKP
jgi:DtxR family transcriptional regulator, Mn-dependent transcriptional regulator